MWKDLSLKEKRELIKLYVSNGITKRSDIIADYNSSVNKFSGKDKTESGTNWMERIVDSGQALSNDLVAAKEEREQLQSKAYAEKLQQEGREKLQAAKDYAAMEEMERHMGRRPYDPPLQSEDWILGAAMAAGPTAKLISKGIGALGRAVINPLGQEARAIGSGLEMFQRAQMPSAIIKGPAGAWADLAASTGLTVGGITHGVKEIKNGNTLRGAAEVALVGGLPAVRMGKNLYTYASGIKGEKSAANLYNLYGTAERHQAEALSAIKDYDGRIAAIRSGRPNPGDYLDDLDMLVEARAGQEEKLHEAKTFLSGFDLSKLKERSNIINGIEYARDFYASRIGQLGENMGTRVQDVLAPKLTVETNLWKSLKNFGESGHSTGDRIYINAAHPFNWIGAAVRPQDKLRQLGAVAAHEGTHHVLHNGVPTVDRMLLGATISPSALGSGLDGYYIANKKHPLYDSVLYAFDDTERIKRAFPGWRNSFGRKWVASPEEYVAEMNYNRWARRIPTYSNYSNYPVDATQKMNNYLAKRFGFTPEDAGYITRKFAEFGYANGGRINLF